MATSKSTSSTPSTAQSVLSAFQQDLFSILDGLQSQANTDASNETTALNLFIQAESNLVSKSTSFGGPSPNFISPTWAGSTAPNGAKSYQVVFESTIKKVLMQKTAEADEHGIILQNLQTNLVNVFKAVFAKVFPSSPATMTPPLAIKWVQDSIIESNQYLGIQDQEGLLNLLTTAIFDKNSTLPPTGTFSANYEPWLKKELLAYLQKVEKQGLNVSKTTQSILKSLKNSLTQYNLHSEESIMEWVETTIDGLPDTLKVTNLQKQELIGALEQDVIQLFPQPDASFFYSNLQKVLFENIYNPPKPKGGSNKVTPPPVAPANLSVIVINNNAKKTLTAYVSGGQTTDGAYAYEWTDSSGATVKPADPKKPNIISADAGKTYSLTVTAGTTTVKKDNLAVYKAKVVLQLLGDVNNVTSFGGNNGSATISASGGVAPYTFVWKNIQTSATPDSTEDDTTNSSEATGLGAGTYLVTATDSTKNTPGSANFIVSITQPATIANNGVKGAIEQILGLKDGVPYVEVTSALANQLENAIKDVIQTAISNTFNKLPEYGAQGQLISSTYDYQLINRVADYVTALVDELKSDYNIFIPTNSSNALNAAQSITSAAVSFREFADSLSQITSAFKSELNHTTDAKNPKPGQAGYTYNQIKNMVYSYTDNPNLAKLSDLANAIYLSQDSSKVPLIQTAELEGVTLASQTAGLSTSLNKLLTGDQSATLASLENMKKNAKASFTKSYGNFNTMSDNYFNEMDTYISALQDFNYDGLKLDAVNNALNTLTQVIETGIAHAGFTDVYAKT